jgi:hypothetical protein
MAATLVATALGLGVAAWWLRPPPADQLGLPELPTGVVWPEDVSPGGAP